VFYLDFLFRKDKHIVYGAVSTNFGSTNVISEEASLPSTSTLDKTLVTDNEAIDDTDTDITGA
jgi:hypothetical protein